MINRLIKTFSFDEDIRRDLIFSDPTKIRLNTEDAGNTRIQLKKNVAGDFPLDADLFIKTPLIDPQAVMKWLKFEAIVKEDPVTFILPTDVGLGFKVRTSGSDFYFDGAAWVVAGLSDWSTEAQLNDNFDTFPIATIGDKKIGFIINLTTTDAKQTPEVRCLKLLGEFDIDYMEDIIYRSFIRKLHTSFRSTSLIVFRQPSTASSVDLDTLLENKGYSITGIRNVFNVTDDPLKLTDLNAGYTPGAARSDGFTFEPGIVDYSSPITADKRVAIAFEYVPRVFVRIGVDYQPYEIPAFPSIVIENITEVFRAGFTIERNAGMSDFIRDKAALTAVKELPPETKVLRLQLAMYTNNVTDQARMITDINSFLKKDRKLLSSGSAREYSLRIFEMVNMSKNQEFADNNDTMVNMATIEILGVEFFNDESIDVPLIAVGGFKITTSI